ncbi:MAG TPA: 2-succinyl-5-enolpyruvyl-6-hydroxy-3-cyclohexene-1-carboxylic-acid synthase [Gammaproteobacteria bacterium]|nr:2-succinyl-5-enolpyruvyl-6-hydroxy-3-cyclohexene-1-carboxylic-acid synthase [Gammaproteobacteria bacterium]
MQQGDINLLWASRLVATLQQCGVRHVVISPGSRSTPLVLAAARQAGLRTHVLADERSAAFFALGAGKDSGVPALVIGTSGSAPANWYPALVEAAQGRVPLLALSADRPPELHDCGANQTLDQTHLFGRFVRGFHAFDADSAEPARLDALASRAAQAFDQSRWPLPGPVHINIAFREPLVGEARLPQEAAPAFRVDLPQLVPPAAAVSRLAACISGRPGLLVAGPTRPCPDLAAALAALAARLDCPLLADPLSGLRYGGHDRSHVIGGYDAFLRDAGFAAAQAPDWIVQFGDAPVSKSLQQYLDRHADHATLVRVSAAGPWPDPNRRGRQFMHADPLALAEALNRQPLAPAPAGWSAAFLEREQRVAAALQAMPRRPLEAQVLETVARQLPAHGLVFAGNSMVIRDCDSFLRGRDAPLRLLANRGASGIDGNVSTLFGLAAAAGRPAVGLLGDLALYHDMNGLAAAREADATLVVFNNGGGAIFGYLPQAGLAEFERFWLTDPALDLALVARLHGLHHALATDAAGFDRHFARALARPGSSLIEVRVDRRDSLEQHRDFWSRLGG